MTTTQDHSSESARGPSHERDPTISTLAHLQQNTQSSPASLEMAHLASQPQRLETTEPSIAMTSPPSEAIAQPPAAHLQAIFSPQNDPTSTTLESADVTPDPLSTSARPKPRPRAETEAIGPASENPVIAVDPAAGPAVLITLLLITGARHPYKIDEKYLKKRNVTTTGPTVDPFSISVYTMKELIWRDWREEWEARPTSPTSIRLIHFGKLLDDKTTLKESRLSDVTPNIVHMTVRPQDVVDEEENAKAGKGTARDRRNSGSSPGCRCIIM